ncbi:MAG: flagellar protein export ATPase FliI [Gammaproteobacteria bacterium]|nr:MAG: flagellar protein export ATPase FliI [Gammaproteobacteria bacterium]
MSEQGRSHIWHERLQAYIRRGRAPVPLYAEGRLVRMVGLTLEAVGVEMPVGGRCLVQSGDQAVEAEVVGFSGDSLYLMPVGDIGGLRPGARVVPLLHSYEVGVGEGLLGRVLDGTGQPIDGMGPVEIEARRPLAGEPVNPMLRAPISEPLDVGIRAINGLFSVGRGQRLGLFAGSGVGKSVLLGMMTRFTKADVIVVGLIGERGREVNEFIRNILGPEGMRRAVVVAVPADQPPLMRLHGAMVATAVAEHFRDTGRNVLLLMDSLTRFAQAQREIALAIGEPPATKGYTPSVFARLPRLVERAGNGPPGSGSITAFYTVLTEGDDHNDPIADAARAILDGHIVLSRDIAEGGRYPAIDVESSISRVMTEIVSPEHLADARRFRQIHATYEQNRDLISVGAYQTGSDPRIDEAIALYPHLEQYLAQDMNEAVDWSRSVRELHELFATVEAGTGGAEAGPQQSTIVGSLDPGGLAR